MVRDYSAFLPGAAPTRREPTALERLGWCPAFASQIDADKLTQTPSVRVVAVHRSGLQLTDAAAGIADVFEDIEALAASCGFTDCRHETEPGCAILAAIEDDSVDPARLARWRKLQAEDAFNSASLAERREKDRAFGKLVRGAIKVKSDRKQ